MARRMMKTLLLASAALALSGLAIAANAQTDAAKPAAAPENAKPAKPHNVIIFVADGLRSGIVNKDNAPTLTYVREHGVDFHNSHSVYPTITTVNASAIATGHRPGDTGEFANNMFLGIPALKAAQNSLIGDMEDDAVLEEFNDKNGGNYLNEVSLLAAARAQGFNTAAIGKEGPVLIQDIGAGDGKSTIVIDDLTGWKHFDGVVPLNPDIAAAIKAAGLDTQAPDRGLNTSPGSYNLPGVIVANVEQQAWFANVATKVLLPKFAADAQNGKPFALVYWSRDPDGTQHNQGDSLNSLKPGINGPTSMAAIHNASDNLQALIDSLKALGLYDTTDIVVTADHGFGTVAKSSRTSAANKMTFPDDTLPGYLPVGFVAIDLAKALNLKLWNSNGLQVDLARHIHPAGAQALGADPLHPDVLIVSGGGSDIIYLDPKKAKVLGPKIVAALATQDYTGGLFADDSFGDLPGALKLSDIGLMGTAKTPRPAVYLSFKTFSTGCENPELCTAIVADTSLQKGQGIHGSLSRAETHNFMAAMGPDFKAGYLDQSPVSNADLTPTLAHILGINMTAKGKLTGRIVHEALATGEATAPTVTPVVKRSKPTATGFVTVLEGQMVGDTGYLDAAGMPGRVVGLKTKK